MEFLYPNVLFMMLIPILVLIFLLATNKDKMQKIFDEATIGRLLVSNKYMTKTTRNVLLFMALILMVIALSRPVMNKREIEIKQEVTPIVVTIDISKSMLAGDIYPTRLALAKRKLKSIIELSRHNAIGVLLFAKSAFILSPITQDFNSLNYLVENFDNGLNFDNGSNIFALLEASNKLLKNYKNKNVLILTDGANKTDFKEEIEFANKNQLKIYAIAMATTKPTPIKTKEGFLTDTEGKIVTVSLNENIKTLSLETNGGYIPFSLKQDDIKAILNDIEIQSQKESLKNQKYKVYTELFYYPLGLALFILLITFSSLRQKQVALLVVLFYLHHSPLQAGLLDFKTINEANEAYEKKEYKKASKKFKEVNQSVQGHYNLANSLYKEKKYKEALNEYKKVITSNKNINYQKLHNMGNTYAKMGQLEDAVKMYEKALKIKNDTQTNENLQRVKKALEKQQQKKQHNKDNKKNKEQKENNKNKKQQDSKKENQKNKKNQKEKNKNQEQKQQNQANQSNNEKNNPKKGKKQEQKTQGAKQQQKQQSLKENEITQREEDKWMKQLQNKKAPVLLRKVPSKNSQEETNSPW